MGERALISVIIPAYNAERTLERTVWSVMASTIPLDVWIVDDGSTDGTGELADRLLQENVNSLRGVEDNAPYRNQTCLHVVHQPNCGAYQARLNALKQIKTPYFGFVDADDTIEPKMFEKMLELAKRGELDVVQVGWTDASCGQSNNLKSNNQIILSGKKEIYQSVVKPIVWEGRSSSFIWDKLYRNQYDFSMFDPTDHVTNFDDLIFNLHFFTKVNRMGFINEPLYHYSATVGSAARKFKWKIVKDFCETLRMRRKMASAYGVHPWGWMNFRWFIKNARNIVVLMIRGVL